VAPYLEKEISKYKRFFLVYKKFNLDEYIIKEKERHQKRKKKRILNSFYRKNILRDHLEQEVYTFLKEFKDTYKESIILWDGHCRLCFKENKRCTYDEGEPCRYTPRYSMEAVGINVDQTIKNLNNDEIKMEWPPEHSAYRFGLVCFK
jgi:predicted metal-binding protein